MKVTDSHNSRNFPRAIAHITCHSPILLVRSVSRHKCNVVTVLVCSGSKLWLEARNCNVPHGPFLDVSHLLCCCWSHCILSLSLFFISTPQRRVVELRNNTIKMELSENLVPILKNINSSKRIALTNQKILLTTIKQYGKRSILYLISVETSLLSSCENNETKIPKSHKISPTYDIIC